MDTKVLSMVFLNHNGPVHYRIPLVPEEAPYFSRSF